MVHLIKISETLYGYSILPKEISLFIFPFLFSFISWLYYYFGRLADTVYDEQLISRAYYKIKEACTRQHVHFQKDQIGVDLGAAPGGYIPFPFLTF